VRIAVRTVGIFEENAYLVIDEATNRAVFIDPGDEPEKLLAMLRESGASLEAIWLTHAHLDHVGAIAGIQRVHQVPVYLHPADLPLYTRAAAQAAAYGIPFEQPDPPDRTLADGESISVGSLAFDVIHVPGHAPGHVVFRRGDVVFGGDLLFAGSIGRTDLPLADPAAMEASLARICELDDAVAVHPGHGPSTTIGQERATNPFLTGAARIVRR
jgi:glyoxylase-like metal-dependent hydrolase (beta-lactamase superfamily II)